MSEKSDFDEIKGPTLNLVIINVIMFILTTILGKSFLSIGNTPLFLFGLSFSLFIHGFIWTPLTSIFTHAGIAHIGSNMIFLFIYGFKLEEDGYNNRQIYFSYIVTGLSAGLLSMIIMVDIIQVGASGAVFGILGTNYGVQHRRGDPNSKKVLFAGIILLVLSSGVRTNVFAHIIGFITGIILGKSRLFDEMGLKTKLI